MPTSSGDSFSQPIVPPVPTLSDNYTVPVHSRHSRGPTVDVELGQELSDLSRHNHSADSSPIASRPPTAKRTAVIRSLDDSEHGREPDATEGERLLHPSTFDPSSDEAEAEGERSSLRQMGKRRANGSVRSSSTNSRASGQNGHANGSMERPLEHRRKHAVLDSPTTATATAHLMNRTSFTLDDPVPPMHTDSGRVSTGFSELPEQDQRNFLLLVVLYFLQGMPLGLASGAVPFLLKQHVGYAQMGIFSLAQYPYSLKLLWSPVVDAVWSPRIGRRKSWIVPIQFLTGLGMLWLASVVEKMMAQAGENNGAGIWGFTWWWFGLVLMCATQDIAVDGWALTLLSPENLAYASTAQTVGLTAGQFLSSTVFLAFNSKDFANKYFRTTPAETGLVSLGGALAAVGWLYIIVTVGLAFLKREDLAKNTDGIWDVYKIMGGILKLKNIQTIVIVHLIAKIGFQANDAATFLKLLDKGFTQDDLALTVLIDFPFEIGLGYYVGKWSQTIPPMQLWCWAFGGRLVAAALAQVIVMLFPSGGVNTGYLILVIVGHVFTTFMGTVMFVAGAAFHARIADPVIGGTYMTLLATVSNLGGTFPRFFVLKFIDIFTSATCHPPTKPPPEDKLKGPLVTELFSCVSGTDRDRCKNGGGSCDISIDGYYIVNILCIIIGVMTFLSYIRPSVLKLQALPLKAWRLTES